MPFNCLIACPWMPLDFSFSYTWNCTLYMFMEWRHGVTFFPHLLGSLHSPAGLLTSCRYFQLVCCFSLFANVLCYSTGSGWTVTSNFIFPFLVRCLGTRVGFFFWCLVDIVAFLFNKYILYSYCMSGTVLSARSKQNRQGKFWHSSNFRGSIFNHTFFMLHFLILSPTIFYPCFL